MRKSFNIQFIMYNAHNTSALILCRSFVVNHFVRLRNNFE